MTIKINIVTFKPKNAIVTDFDCGTFIADCIFFKFIILSFILYFKYFKYQNLYYLSDHLHYMIRKINQIFKSFYKIIIKSFRDIINLKHLIFIIFIYINKKKLILQLSNYEPQISKQIIFFLFFYCLMIIFIYFNYLFFLV